MRSKFAIYFSILTMIVMASSCSNDATDESFTPYAYIKSFNIGSIKSEYPAFTDKGKDTLVVKTISFSSCKFTIDHSSGEVYNSDSLLYATDISKVVVNMSVEGIASIYNDKTAAFEYLTVEDSIDFTNPRKLRITSSDGSYNKDYTVSVNVHQVEPDLMVWKDVAGSVNLNPQKAVEFNNRIYVFGTLVDKTLVYTSAAFGETISWSIYEYPALPKTADFSTLHLFNGMLYVLAGGDLYSSNDAVTWELALQGYNLLAIIGASDADGCMWLANAENIYRTVDGVSVEVVSASPENIPLYGVSSLSYPLSHNDNIIRYMLVGYTTPELRDNPKVWSKLSTEQYWTEFENTDNPYPCPALKGLTVMRYDNFLYAFGGEGTVGENSVEAFNSFYISKDNGLVWKAPKGFYQLLPEGLKGQNVSFVSFVDSDDYMWIITSDEKIGTWKGKINRLGFKK